MVHERFNALTEEQKAYFLSVEVDRLLKLYEDDMGKSLLPSVRQSAITSLRLTYLGIFRGVHLRVTHVGASELQMLYHIYDHIIVDETVHSVVLARLMS